MNFFEKKIQKKLSNQNSNETFEASELNPKMNGKTLIIIEVINIKMSL